MNSALVTILSLVFALSCAVSNRQQMSHSHPAMITTESGLQYMVTQVGTGPTAQQGQFATIHETTRLKNGTVITDTWSMNHPIRFQLGAHQVIKGMDEAVTGMRVGEERKLIVPPSLSQRAFYPENALFGPNDTLYYQVILLQVEEKE